MAEITHGRLHRTGALGRKDPADVLAEVIARTEPAAALDAAASELSRMFESDVAIYVADGTDLRLHGLHPPTAMTGLSAQAATWTLASGDTVHVPCGSACPAPPIGFEAGTAVLSKPLLAGGRTVGVVVVWRFQSIPFTHGGVDTLERMARTLALAADRQIALDRMRVVSARATAAQEQLEAYARDVRHTYGLEKERAAELESALGELETTYLATVRGLAVAVEAKDAYTAGHLTRVERYATAMMRHVDPVAADDPQLHYGFLLHDIGKLAVPDAILGKPGKLDDAEWEVIKRHPELGCWILADIPFLETAREIVWVHHERWDGGGYPRGLRGEEIPVAGRVFPLADALDAMTSSRPYRAGMSYTESLARIREGSGTQFWPEAVEALHAISPSDLAAIGRGELDA